MTSRDFCYWLQGYFEISGAVNGPSMSAEQTTIIRRHLALVFKHEIDPSMGGPEKQEVLNNLHGTAGPAGPSNPGEVLYRC